MTPMRSRTYRAKTMKEALTRVRRDLGGDAVILAAREVRRRRLFGLGAQAQVEVTATDHMPEEAVDVTRTSGLPADVAASRVAASSGQSPTLQARFGEQLSRLHAMVETLNRQGRIDHLLPDVPGELVPIYSQLIEAEIPEVLTRRLVRHVAENLPKCQNPYWVATSVTLVISATPVRNAR